MSWRSAVRRGLQAGPSQPNQPEGDRDPSEAGGPVPSDSQPPSLPPGPPSTTSSAPPLTLEEAVSQWCAEDAAGSTIMQELVFQREAD